MCSCSNSNIDPTDLYFFHFLGSKNYLNEIFHTRNQYPLPLRSWYLRGGDGAFEFKTRPFLLRVGWSVLVLKTKNVSLRNSDLHAHLPFLSQCKWARYSSYMLTCYWAFGGNQSLITTEPQSLIWGCLIPRSHQSLNIFQSCFVEHGSLKLVFSIGAA